MRTRRIRRLATQPSSAADGMRRCLRSLLSILAVGVLLPGCLTAGTGVMDLPATPEFTFEEHEIVTGPAKHQTVLTGSFLAGAIAQLAVVSIDENDGRRLRIYGLDDGDWAPRIDAALRPGVLFVDVANIAGRDRLITYESGRLNWFDPDSATERALVEVTTNYNATPLGLTYAGADNPSDEGDIPHVEITRDLNRDDRDDFVVPDVDGFWVCIQRSDGTFADPVKLGPPEPFRDEIALDETRSYGEVGISPLTVPWYMSRVHEMDYDLDGRNDLVFWNEDHFEVHRQDASGLFSPVAETFVADVPFDSDGAYSLIFGFSGESTFSLVFGLRKKSRRTVLQSVRDMNDDGAADLVIHSLEGRSLLRQRSRYDVHFGRPTPDGIRFGRDVSAAIRPRGRAGGIEIGGYSSLWLRDFDGDGQVDILRGDVKIGIGAMVRALLRSSISMGAELYRMEDGAYPEKATSMRNVKIKIKAKSSDGGRDAGFFPAVLVGDVNGDGRSDVLVGKSREELYVFLGGQELLAPQPQKVAVALPGDERNSWLVDLDQDGRQDVLMHHPSATEPHRVTMLIAR